MVFVPKGPADDELAIDAELAFIFEHKVSSLLHTFQFVKSSQPVFTCEFHNGLVLAEEVGAAVADIANVELLLMVDGKQGSGAAVNVLFNLHLKNLVV